ncbi:hypothetical protein [Methylobacterium sp.]|uniref:hypothetical protein n=1 Tax=Methylobacterium sp. TaxID=409 RepID=UPI0025E9A517|nr:hypothetical protein [Methylobacterium sp.]
MMAHIETTSPQSWIDPIASGYAAEATPPLTDELLETLRAALNKIGLDHLPVGHLDEKAVERINQTLDTFELDLGAVVGPRIEAPSDDGTITFRHRSEAGRPLRAYGGQ